MSVQQIQEQFWKFFKGKGLPEKSIAAIMGNISMESRWNPKVIESGGGGGFGLAQWTGGRRTQLQRYGTSLNHQMTFLWAELTGEGAKNAGANKQWTNCSKPLSLSQFMAGQGSIEQLTKSFMSCWERPKEAEYSSKLRAVRIPEAHKFYKKFTGIGGDYSPAYAGASTEEIETMKVEGTNYKVVKGSEKYGDYLFGRRVRITVSDTEDIALDVSELHCTFSILKTIQMEPNMSLIAIYNLNAETENIIRIGGTRVTVEAGYEGKEFGLIFDGDIIQCIQEKEGANTFKLTIVALDSDRAINLEVANFSILRGQSHREMVENIVNTAKYPMKLGSISDKLKDIKLTRGKVLFGKSSDYLEQIAKTHGLKFYMDNGRVNLIDLKKPPKERIIKIGPESGLVGVPEQTDFGVTGQTLLNPQIKLNTLVHIEPHLIKDKQVSFGTPNATPDTGSTPSGDGSSGGQPSQGGWLIPYNGEFKITSAFRPPHRPRHQGIDIGMKVGTTLYASKAGKVLKAGSIGGGGGTGVMLTHDNNGASNYFHMSKLSVSTGQTVTAGQKIGLSGNTGRSTGPHLHFEITENGQRKDPAGVIKGATGGNPPPPSFSSAKQNAPEGGAGHGWKASSSDDAFEGGEGMTRALDKDGIYRVIKLEYQGDTRGNDWYINFETITQIGGEIPIISK